MIGTSGPSISINGVVDAKAAQAPPAHARRSSTAGRRHLPGRWRIRSRSRRGTSAANFAIAACPSMPVRMNHNAGIGIGGMQRQRDGQTRNAPRCRSIRTLVAKRCLPCRSSYSRPTSFAVYRRRQRSLRAIARCDPMPPKALVASSVSVQDATAIAASLSPLLSREKPL